MTLQEVIDLLDQFDNFKVINRKNPYHVMDIKHAKYANLLVTQKNPDTGEISPKYVRVSIHEEIVNYCKSSIKVCLVISIRIKDYFEAKDGLDMSECQKIEHLNDGYFCSELVLYGNASKTMRHSLMFRTFKSDTYFNSMHKELFSGEPFADHPMVKNLRKTTNSPYYATMVTLVDRNEFEKLKMASKRFPESLDIFYFIKRDSRYADIRNSVFVFCLVKDFGPDVSSYLNFNKLLGYDNTYIYLNKHHSLHSLNINRFANMIRCMVPHKLAISVDANNYYVN